MKRMASVARIATGATVGLALIGAQGRAAAFPLTAISGLKLDIVDPSVHPGDSVVDLDVTFRGNDLASIELSIDGSPVKTQAVHAGKTHGKIRFEVDASLLPPGNHEIKVRAIDADGDESVTSTHVTIAGAAVSGPAELVYPKMNGLLQGIVPLEVQVDAAMKSAYVAFFVDNQILAMMNYAPYTYNWDTTRVGNGPHVLSVEVYDGQSLAKIKLPDVPIRVNNPGGFTNRQTETPDLNIERAVRTPAAPRPAPLTALPPAQTETPEASIHPMLGVPALSPMHAAVSPEMRIGRAIRPRARIAAPSVTRVSPMLPEAAAPVRRPAVPLLPPAPGAHHSMPELAARASCPDFIILPSAPAVTSAACVAGSATRPALPTGQPDLHAAPAPMPSVVPKALLPPAPSALQVSPEMPSSLLHARPSAPHVMPLPLQPAEPVLPQARIFDLQKPDAAPMAHSSAFASVASSPIAHRPTGAHPATAMRGLLPAGPAILSVPSPPEIPAPVNSRSAISHLAAPALRAGNMAAIPALRLAPASPAVRIRVTVAPRARRVENTMPLLLRRHGIFGVSFNDRPVHFDVQPRVEHGLPLLPFRQLFERTGGTVSWQDATQTVHAVNSDKDVLLTIGNRRATINSETVTLDAAPTLQSGRTIVPLSFVKQALDVEIHYDPLTGKVLLERR